MTNKLNFKPEIGVYPKAEIQMELECELVTNGLYVGDPSGYNDPRAKELEKNVNDWTLLLQVDSDHEKTGMMWE